MRFVVIVFFFLLLAAPAFASDLYVLTRTNPARILVFDSSDTGNTAPKRTIEGDATTMRAGNVYGLEVYNGEIFVADEFTGSILVFKTTDSGNVAPQRTISGGNTGFNLPRSIWVENGEIFVADESAKSVFVFNVTDNGNVAPKRTLSGGNTGLATPSGLTVSGSELFVMDMSADKVYVFNVTDNGNVAPKRILTTTTDGGFFFARGIGAYGSTLFVGDGGRSSITTFPLSASGAVAASTQIKGASATISDPHSLTVQGAELFVAHYSGSRITVYGTSDSGDVAPRRTITGAATLLSSTIGIAFEHDSGTVRAADTQPSGVTLNMGTQICQNATTSNYVTNSTLPREGDTPVGLVFRYNATVSPTGSLAVFRTNSTLWQGPLSGLQLVKLYGNGTSADFRSYAANNTQSEGAWWMTHANGTYVNASTDTLRLGTEYHLYAVLKDDGTYDVSPASGVIEDPMVLVQSGDGSSSGCALDPHAAFSWEWPLLLLAAGLFLAARRAR